MVVADPVVVPLDPSGADDGTALVAGAAVGVAASVAALVETTEGLAVAVTRLEVVLVLDVASTLPPVSPTFSVSSSDWGCALIQFCTTVSFS